ncbi:MULTISPECIES: recombination-associated protein RdgC [Pasteurellaceae]|uniref:Recombination-associated protein RdgC n=1 Tax=Pasteurella atlantica TaxID=2827233 RepID=A0AAW8CKF2_9PAST|nr:recombination-associated protein RdgC [Pasteurella atlantica]MBR0574567.1 recombination-associated protein RdgC [Pasteurella atlantica]MDP8040437.1 recombination-associated protein RdgC [Pasteurella atlantica]MDP8042603.1 recombination-associated protein RdgC [Pasteurella atlantica]MDP8044702.1 recombination-associated protein RdgC [Pasteurella atlantica]MDP8046750.1 recombination-associated protein RdgC [Pasteurella atlantica]
MYWFKNVMIYRLTSPLEINSDELETKLQANKYHPCSQSEMSKFGWGVPLVTSDLLHFNLQKQFLLVSHKEEKILPAPVIKAEMEERIAVLEEKENRKLKKTEKQAIKDDVVAMLLSRAFSKHQHTAIWLDLETQLVYVDSASSKRAEDTLALLRKTLGSLPVVPISFTLQPSEVMTNWVAKGHTPNWLTLLEEAELKSFDTESVIRCKRQDLETEEIGLHLTAGKYVTKLALEWEEHFSFVLNDDATLSRVKYADDIKEKNDDILKEDIAQRFDADFVLMTGELKQFTQNLIEEFGGIKERL